MSIILNFLTLILCIWWLFKSNKKNQVLVGIVFTFLGGTLVSFILALALEHDYLDGLIHLMVAGGSAVLFWLVSLVLILSQRNNFSSTERLVKILILSIVVLLPLFIYLLVANMSFKIGG